MCIYTCDMFIGIYSCVGYLKYYYQIIVLSTIKMLFVTVTSDRSVGCL